jgi:hypothetical protein
MTNLKRAETREELRSQPGRWWPVSDGKGERSAIISCPGCGEVNSLSLGDLRPGWVIAPDGTVSPSVNHSWPIRKTDGTVIPSCTFHDNIKLEGWGS